MLVRPLSTVDNTRNYARVSHSRQWSNYNVNYSRSWPLFNDYCLDLWFIFTHYFS